MASVARFYGKFFEALFNKELDLNAGDVVKAMICTSTYTPNYATHKYKSDVTNEVVGTGYTAGGAAVATPTAAVVVANSWPVSRANTTAYVVGQVVRPATGNGNLYQCITAGTSAGTIPTYPTTVGGTVTDGTVTWLCASDVGALVFDGADVSWASSVITGRTVVIYDDTPATDAAKPLICAVVSDVDIISSGPGTWSSTWATEGICAVLI